MPWSQPLRAKKKRIYPENNRDLLAQQKSCSTSFCLEVSNLREISQKPRFDQLVKSRKRHETHWSVILAMWKERLMKESTSFVEKVPRPEPYRVFRVCKYQCYMLTNFGRSLNHSKLDLSYILKSVIWLFHKLICPNDFFLKHFKANSQGIW